MSLLQQLLLIRAFKYFLWKFKTYIHVIKEGQAFFHATFLKIVIELSFLTAFPLSVNEHIYPLTYLWKVQTSR